MAQPDSAPLTGYRVAVTSARRADELCAMLRRQGAEVYSAPAISMIALPDDDELHSNTEALIVNPPDILVAHTGIGFRGWVAAAEGWGLASQLVESLSAARIVSRGPKATGALRAAGLREEWSPESESSQEVLEYLLESGVSGMRIAIQLHGAADAWDPFPDFLSGLRSAGAEVVPLRVYRWKPTPLGGEFDQLVTGIARRQFDAVSFTSAPAAAAVLERGRELGIEDQLVEAMRTAVHAMCVGPVTSRPLIRRGIPTSAPERMRLGALARHIAEELPLLGSCSLKVAGHLIDIRGTCVLVDGSVKTLSGSGMAILRALAQRPGDVVARGDLLRVLPGNGDDTHAVDTAVLRLRTALGDKNIVATVVKRGYRLAVDPERGAR
ncbi:uroporphyrinogen-III synthase [Mycobacterium riyadhense]|uniref:Bifunctional uroporphyrinogen-III synthetase/response regulator domain protein n=1 Tax=Mycobacterium riyadhense TaxID=486698 RepID=A0A1X2CBD4_9MYCO|nr:uroporphyrinogen-III synthase [Mycobacterium riyadhense]MCV7148481.1 uroporphyrinogen-III synthase [Mycobacterium riyadhense]ORW73202.1 bifunctional uroporphyrinogen-III synthetase/response regulator domain protein [Mycobacterium riyadhense]VTO95371.1 bifunctional uroporphyrinogen-III synthetase/response regulator domain protein [Mycobacterium riyadhense]